MRSLSRPISQFSRLPAGLQLTAGAVLISFSGVYVTLARVTPMAAGFYRMAFGGLILLAVLAWRREFRRIGARAILAALFCSLWFAVDLFCWHTCIHLTGPGLATLLANFQVFFLALAGVLFLGEKVRLKLVLAVPLALLGLFLVVGIQWDCFGPGYRTGIYFGLGAAVCYTGFLLTLRRLQNARNNLSAMESLTLVSIFTVLFLGISIWQTGDTFRIPDARSGTLLFAYGLFSQVVGWVLITRALPRVRVSFAGLVLLLQPALSYVWDILFFDKVVTTIGMAGLLMTLFAIYLGSTRTTE
jgi:drug/metabolite transporter (DMT)-like permease